MMVQTKFVLAAVAGLAGAGFWYPLCAGGVGAGCDAGVGVAGADNSVAAQQVSDTATVKLHISGMTCGSCPVTARLALKRLPGVLGAEVTLDDSLGVVRYDPRRVTPEQIAAHLTRQTGYGARILAEGRPPAPRGKE